MCVSTLATATASLSSWSSNVERQRRGNGRAARRFLITTVTETANAVACLETRLKCLPILGLRLSFRAHYCTLFVTLYYVFVKGFSIDTDRPRVDRNKLLSSPIILCITSCAYPYLHFLPVSNATCLKYYSIVFEYRFPVTELPVREQITSACHFHINKQIKLSLLLLLLLMMMMMMLKNNKIGTTSRFSLIR